MERRKASEGVLVDPSPFKVDDKLPKGIKVQQSPEGVINRFKSKYAVNTCETGQWRSVSKFKQQSKCNTSTIEPS